MRWFLGICLVAAFAAMVVLVINGHIYAIAGFVVIVVGALQAMRGTERARVGGSDGSDVQQSGLSKLRNRS